MLWRVLYLLPLLISPSLALFKCPSDGHWPNPESCSSYFHCANGRPYEGSCPAGLLWNGVKSECDFPENVNCDISLGEAAKLKVAKGSYVYMTFDDGPNEGTPYVLDALKEVRNVFLKYFLKLTFSFLALDRCQGNFLYKL